LYSTNPIVFDCVGELYSYAAGVERAHGRIAARDEDRTQVDWDLTGRDAGIGIDVGAH
jgi:hypothetical protein